jgi:hypothetical protein
VGRTNYVLKTLQFKTICPTLACTTPIRKRNRSYYFITPAQFSTQHSSLDTRKENCTRAPLVEATRGAPRVLTRATRATASDATRERHERHPTNEWHGRRHERRLPAASQFGTRPADDCTWGLQLDLLRKELAPLFHCLVELVQLKLLCARNVRERILLLLASF